MRVVLVRYERKVQVRQYEPETVGIEVALEEGESAQEAIERARNFVAAQFGEIPGPLDLAERRAALEEIERVHARSFT